ncbi:MAG: metallophosphoesterase, partial [Anaerolineales bacterium]
RLDKSFSGLRIAQISDLHFGGWMTTERLYDIARLVLAQSADIVVITGDFVMGYDYFPGLVEKLDGMAGALKLITDRALTLGVLGNHDYWLDPNLVVDMMHQAGIKVLRNSIHTYVRGNHTLHFAGIDDALVYHSRMSKLLPLLPDEGCAIVLVHEPDYADYSAGTGRFDLQLSGHSHGGQVVLPFIGAPVLPRMAHKYPSGLYQVKDMYQYTNRGVGMTPPYVRFNCRPEITVFTLESS